MSSFNSCYRELKRFAAFSPSHAWIYLHWCVESYARLTGQTFTAVFAELEEMFGFQREIKRNWPSAEQILKAADYLNQERTIFLENYNRLIAERKKQKKAGVRHPLNDELDLIARKQQAAIFPEVGIWGWKKLRKK